MYLDGGVRSGADVAASVALGARAAFVARPYLYALMAGGEAGVEHLATRLAQDYARTLRLLGSASTGELTRDLVSLPPGRRLLHQPGRPGVGRSLSSGQAVDVPNELPVSKSQQIGRT